MSINLYDKRHDVYSQNGEDGILAALLEALDIKQGYYVEFGAWDGMHLSNTYNLYKNGWSGLLIEADEGRFEDLKNNIPDPAISKVNAMVSLEGANSLDQILKAHDISDVDLLSVDIDSDDLRTWESVTTVDPKIVIIEYNPVIPFDTRYVNPQGKMHGNSALSITESANKRGYELVEGTDTNLIFVKREALEGKGIAPKSLQAIRDQSFQLRYFIGYDGTLLHNFDKMNDAGITEFYPVPWALSFGSQPIPLIVRRYHDCPNIVAIVFFSLGALLRSPIQFFKLCMFIVKTASAGRSFSELVGLIANKGKLTSTFKDTSS